MTVIVIAVGVVVVVPLVLGACVYLAGAHVMVRWRKQQPLGKATRVEITGAERGFQMDGNDTNEFQLGSGRPAEDQHGIVPRPL